MAAGLTECSTGAGCAESFGGDWGEVDPEDLLGDAVRKTNGDKRPVGGGSTIFR
jgi:hypothetical protein